DPDGAVGLGGGGLDPLQLGAGHRAVDGDDDLVGGRVGPPGGAGDLGGAVELGGGPGQLGGATLDELGGRTGGADLAGGNGVGDRDDHLAAGVGVAAGGAVTEALGQAGGGVGGGGAGRGMRGGTEHRA